MRQVTIEELKELVGRNLLISFGVYPDQRPVLGIQIQYIEFMKYIGMWKVYFHELGDPLIPEHYGMQHGVKLYRMIVYRRKDKTLYDEDTRSKLYIKTATEKEWNEIYYPSSGRRKRS